jgi:hypothetical protein
MAISCPCARLAAGRPRAAPLGPPPSLPPPRLRFFATRRGYARPHRLFWPGITGHFSSCLSLLQSATAEPQRRGGGALPPPAGRGRGRIGADTRPNSPVTPPQQEAEGGARNRPPRSSDATNQVCSFFESSECSDRLMVMRWRLGSITNLCVASDGPPSCR